MVVLCLRHSQPPSTPLFSLLLDSSPQFIVAHPFLLLLNSKSFINLEETPLEITHEPLGWYIKLGFNDDKYTLSINGLDYAEMTDAPPRERAELARTEIIYKLEGPKR